MPLNPLQTPTAPMPAAPGAGQPSLTFLQDPVLNQSVKDQICALRRRFSLERIAETVEANLHVTVSREQILAVWAERYAPEIEAAPEPEACRPDKESVHPADAPRECLLTPPAAAPEPEPPLSIVADAPPTRTGPGQEKAAMQIPPVADTTDAPDIAEADPADSQTDSDQDPPPTQTAPGQKAEPLEILPTEVREFIIGRMASRAPVRLIADEVRRKFGFEVDHDEIVVCWRDRDEALTIRTGPGPEKESRQRLTDEIKAFIVKRLACYETPSRIAAAVRINFGIDVDRRRIFDYDPKGSRPPAQRWIDLHAATRARFLRDVAEIGIAQKVIRLKMLDRFAEMAEDNHRHDKAAKYLDQAARECGGFYEKRRALPAAAAGATD